MTFSGSSVKFVHDLVDEFPKVGHALIKVEIYYPSPQASFLWFMLPLFLAGQRKQ